MVLPFAFGIPRPVGSPAVGPFLFKGSCFVDAEPFQPVRVFLGGVSDKVCLLDNSFWGIALGEIDSTAHTEQSTYRRRRNALA